MGQAARGEKRRMLPLNCRRMSKCLTCGEPIEVKKGKRAKLYCSDLCRLRGWQKKNKRPIGRKQTPPPLTENEQILRQIAFLEAELIPPERNGLWGRKLWQKEQDEKIKQLKSKIK